MLTPREEQEMAEVLESECAVEMDKLATLCRLGIPERLRAEAVEAFPDWEEEIMTS